MIRQALAADASAVAAIVDAAYAVYLPVLGQRPRPMTDDHAARIARSETFVLEAQSMLVGAISLEPQPDALHIYSIALSPAVQGRGFLHQLLGFAEHRARSLGLPLLTLYTNVRMQRNRAIYAHVGFTETAIEDGGGYRIVLMQRPVGPA